MLLFIFNPLTYKVSPIFFSGDYLAYYSRMFEMIPIIYIIAHGLIIIIKKIDSKWIKLSCVCIISIVIVCTGAEWNSFNRPWMKPAKNLQKVPDGLSEICSFADKDRKNVCIAVPSEVSGYIRQIDASLYTPYGRSGSELGDELGDTDSPNIDYIMKKAAEFGCDYLITINTDKVYDAYIEAGMKPLLKTEGYMLYEVKGVPRVVREYNEKRQMISLSNTNANGTLIPFNNDGYCTVCFEYDKNGNQCKEYYLDVNGDMVNMTEGYAMIEKTYYAISGLEKSIAYNDKNGKEVKKLPVHYNN